MAIGVFPETDLAREAGLEIGETGGIKVDRNYLTNDRDIYAIGDAIEVYHRLSRKKTRLALAGPARQARAAIDHIYNIPSPQQWGNRFIGSERVFDINAACTA